MVEVQSLPCPRGDPLPAGKTEEAGPWLEKRLGAGCGDCPWKYLEKSAQMTKVPGHPDQETQHSLVPSEGTTVLTS